MTSLHKNRAFKVVAVIVALPVLASMITAIRAVRLTVAELHPPRELITEDQRTQAMTIRDMKDVRFRTSDGLSIAGWHAPNRNGCTVVFANGVGGTRTALLHEALCLAAKGYGVLLFDWRAHGQSEGNLCTWGDLERLDFQAAVDYVARVEGDSIRIGAVGFSLGASVVALVSAQDRRVHAMILQAMTPSLREAIEQDFRAWGPIASIPSLFTYRYYGVRVNEVAAKDATSTLAPRPVMIATGERDPYVTRAMAERVYATTGNPKELYVVPGAGHGHFVEGAGQDYLLRIVQFFDTHLLKKSAGQEH